MRALDNTEMDQASGGWMVSSWCCHQIPRFAIRFRHRADAAQPQQAQGKRVNQGGRNAGGLGGRARQSAAQRQLQAGRADVRR